jgi:hypothetical protein
VEDYAKFVLFLRDISGALSRTRDETVASPAPRSWQGIAATGGE